MQNVSQVELETKVIYKGGGARFLIRPETEGIYTALLISFTGESSQSPPGEITLVRGVRNWAGSIEDEILLGELGKFIDSCWPQNEGSEIIG
jgi:hypothetical protein